MKTIQLILMIAVVVGCASTPKGEYAESKIDRPYNLPQDVAKFSFGVTSVKIETEDDQGEIDDFETTSPAFLFEDGVWENVSWIYPLGVRWKIYNHENHTVGASVFTIIFASVASLDYWYRLSSNISLRPFYSHTRVDTFIINTSRDTTGLELVYQPTKKLSISPKYAVGKLSSSSDFVETLFEDITEEEADTFTEGTLSSFNIEFLYSIDDKWDVFVSAGQDKTEYDNYSFTSTEARLGANFFY